jgi:hypothetical protein
MAPVKPTAMGPIDPATLKPKGLALKLAEIMATIPDVKPEGSNKFFNYQYITDKQVNGLIRPKLAAAGICVIPDVEEHEIMERETAKQGKSLLTRLVIRFTLIDGETGQVLSGRGEGYGDDSGDKGANKAFTAAMKFWLMKVFMIGGEDAEADEATDKRYAGDGGSSRPVTVTASSSKREVAKGGRNVGTTDVQVNEIARLSSEAGLDHYGLAAVVRATVGKEVTLPEDETERRTVLRAFLTGLTGEEAGKVIQMLMESHVVTEEAEGVPVDASPVSD